MQEALKGVMADVSIFFEIAGVAVIVVGFVIAAARAGSRLSARDGAGAYDAARGVFGRAVLLGLEVLVAADLIRTIAVAPTLENLYVLGLLILIRTGLSWSLDVEIDGMWPWQKRVLEDREIVDGIQR